MNVSLRDIVAVQNLNNKSLVIDCGGYLGDYTREVVDKFDCSVVVFEPVPLWASACRKRFADNNKVEVFASAVGDIAGKRSLYLDDESSSFFRPSKTTEEVTVIRLSDFLSDKKVDCLKLNCEGSEYEVLQDLYNRKMLKGIKEILVQFHRFSGNRVSRLKLRDFRRMLSETHSRIPCSKWDLWRRK